MPVAGHPDTVSVLRTRLLTTAGLPACAWANRAFTPTPGVPFVSDDWLGGTDEQQELGPGRVYTFQGAYQLLLHYPRQAGILPVLELAESIKLVFRSGGLLTPSGKLVRVLRFSEGPEMGGVADSDWFIWPLTLFYELTR
jgi:hypothetical protein